MVAATLCSTAGLGWAAAGPPAPEASSALSVGTAALLGAVQGATEFLPVSSSGHLSLGQAWLGIDPSSAGHRFNIAVHAATLIAVLWVYRRDVGALLRAAARPTIASADRTRLAMMFLASLPLGIVLIPGVERMVIAMESNVMAIGIALWVTGLILLVAFRGQQSQPATVEALPPKPWQALVIGVVQVSAVLPGISRSGSTIAAGLAVGLDRNAAARFSFLISLIAVGGASAKEVLEIISEPPGTPIPMVPFAVGFASSLVVGLLSLRGLLYLVNKGRVGVFVVYLAIVGGIAVYVGAPG